MVAVYPQEGMGRRERKKEEERWKGETDKEQKIEGENLEEKRRKG